MAITELVGLTGTMLVAIAYMPQIAHLIKSQCSAGISLRAWSIWLIASSLIFIHALTTQDLIFKLLIFFQLSAIATILFFSNKFKGKACKSHKLLKK